VSEVRVMLVDDSSIARRIMIAAFKGHPEIEVVAAAPTGEAALARLPQVKPDVVILDVEMPGMDGVETLRRIRAQYPKLPVVMFSALTERGAMVTVQALAAGASDYVCKPSAIEGRSSEDVVSKELVPKLLALCGRRSLGKIARSPVGPTSVSAIVPKSLTQKARSRIEVLVIASSTGGPNALVELLPRLPANLPVPVVLVQHMPPVFTRYLAERIDAAGPLRAVECAGGELLTAGCIFVAPGDYHLQLTRDERGVVTQLTQAEPENSCRPAADVLFRSAAAVYGPNVLGVVLTGMGQDGLVGARAISKAGGQILAQDEASCVVWGMPKAVEQAGLADGVHPLEDLPREIVERCSARAGLKAGAL